MEPTSEALELHELAELHQKYIGHQGYLDRALSKDGQPIDDPINTVPHGFIEFDDQQAALLPGVGSSTTVLTMSVPQGYDGVIKKLSHNFTGAGFTPGSGHIVWRLFADGRAIRNFSNMTSEKGTVEDQRDLVAGIRVYSGQTITYVVEHVANAGLSGNIVCSLTGYFYPSRGG